MIAKVPDLKEEEGWTVISGSELARRSWNCHARFMCGIVAYIGPSEALPVLLDGLRRLEYRGYDSAGLALLNPSGI